MIKSIIALLSLGALSINAYAEGEAIYGPTVEAWNDNASHKKGTHYERQLTPPGRAWKEKALALGYSEKDISTILHLAYAEGNKLPPDPTPVVDSDSRGFIVSTEEKAPNFNLPFASGPLNRALKEQLNDPGSYKFLDATDPVRETKNGTPCWTVVVHFLAKNAFGGVMRNYAYLSVVENGQGGWRVIDCRINA
jgi:hypothetical protein